MDPRIEEYIRVNRGSYTREAIRQQLIDAGYEPADIDATWEMLHAPDPDEAGVAGERFWGRFFLFLIGLNVAVFLLVTLSTGMLGGIGQGYGVLAIVLAVVLAIGALIAWGIVAVVGPEKLSRTTAMVVGASIPIVFALLIGGSCYALAVGIGPPPPPAHSGVMELHVDPPVEFEGSGAATCQPHGGEAGYSVFAENVGTSQGRTVSVSIDVFRGGGAGAPTPAPGNEDSVGLYIMLNPTGNPTDAPAESYTNTGSAALGLDAATDGLSGTLTFDGLAPEPFERPPDVVVNTEPISGTINWTCEGGE
jgi:hypothetical protein